MWRSCRTRVASDKSGTLSPSCLLLVEMEKGGRGGALYLKSKLSLASLEKLGALFSKLFFPKVKLKNPKIQETRRGRRQETIIWMRPRFYSSTLFTAFTGCSRWAWVDFSKCTTSSNQHHTKYKHHKSGTPWPSLLWSWPGSPSSFGSALRWGVDGNSGRRNWELKSEQLRICCQKILMRYCNYNNIY